MALNLNFDVCVINDCSEVKFTETTGIYSATNLGGYGTPNIATTDAVSCQLDVTSPNGVLVTINMITAGFPSSNTSLSRVLTQTMMAVTSITDGEWIFTYRVSDGVDIAADRL